MERKEGYRWSRGNWRPTDRQREVLDLLVESRTNAEIASALGISFAAAKWHVSELLAETGCDDRQALAAWWRKERRPAILPALWPNPFAFGTAAAVMALLVMAVAWLLVARSGGQAELARSPEAPTSDGGFVSGSLTTPLAPDFNDFLIELTVEGPYATSRVDLRDLKTGESIASVDGGFRPMVVVRQKAEELLVASGYGDGSDYQRLLKVYDLRNYSMTLKRTIPVSGLVTCTIYCQPMVLARDEHHLYYAKRTVAPECGTHDDGAACDLTSIVVLDLEDPARDQVATDLPRGCGVPALSASGESGAVASCPGQYPVTGGFTQRFGPGGGEQTVDTDSGTPRYVFTTSDGSVVQLTALGDVKVFREDGTFAGVRALPSPSDVGITPRVVYPGAVDLGDDRLFITFDDGAFTSPNHGFVIFDLESMSIQAYGLVPNASAYLPNGNEVYVLRNGIVEILDLSTGRLTDLANVSEGVEVLLPGR